jgi:hypothetical protein
MNYLARVELNGAAHAAYEDLHREMERRGYQKEIAANDGLKYSLPPGTYYVAQATVSLERAYSAAKEAADATGYRNEVLVAEVNSSRFDLRVIR